MEQIQAWLTGMGKWSNANTAVQWSGVIEWTDMSKEFTQKAMDLPADMD